MAVAALKSSTAMRALPSTLASRAAPTVPPASQTYEPLVKSVLRHRLLFRTFVYSGIFSWILVVLASSVSQGRSGKLGLVGLLLSPISPRTIIFSFVIWLFSVVPVIVMRKTCLTAITNAAATPSKVFHSALNKSSTIRVFLGYTTSAAIITFIHVAITQMFSDMAGNDPRLSIFVKSRKHPYYLNGRLVYFVSSQLAIAALMTFRNVQLDRCAVRWTSALTVNRKDETPSFMLARVVTVLISSLVLSTLGLAVHAALFGLTRAIVMPVIFRLPIASRLLRPFMAHFLRGSWTFTLLTRNVTLVIRAWAVGFMMIINWDFAESIFDAMVAEPVNVTHSTADPLLTLVSGIKSTDVYYKHFAYAELHQLASEESPAASNRRTALFADQKYNPNTWSTLVRETLVALGQDYQLFLRRGAPPPPATAPAAEPPKKVEAPKEVPKAPFVRTQVLKPSSSSPLRSALDTIASDGPINAVLSSTAEAGASQIPELFRSVMPSHPPSALVKAEAVVETVKKSEQEIQKLVLSPAKLTGNLWGVIARYSPSIVARFGTRVAKWWCTERIHKIAEASLPNRKMDGLAIDALCSFVCASLTEDMYGVVQRDIPRIVEALLSFLSALEEYRAELHIRYPPPSPEELSNMTAGELATRHDIMIEVSRASDILSEVEDPLKEGIVKIVRTFGEKLGAFKFPSRTAQKLQGFVDYN